MSLLSKEVQWEKIKITGNVIETRTTSRIRNSNYHKLKSAKAGGITTKRRIQY
jgi:hypothetical protein